MELNKKKQKVQKHFDKISNLRKKFINRNKYYYQDLKNFFQYNISSSCKVLEIGCGIGNLISSIETKKGVGIDISEKMIKAAQKENPNIEFRQMDPENLELNEKFDYVILSDTLGYLEDIQKCFSELRECVHLDTRVIITTQNFLWNPILNLAEKIGLRSPSLRLNWLNTDDIVNLLELEDYDIIKSGKRFLIPVNIPLISWFINKYIANLPVFNRLCLTQFIIARPRFSGLRERGLDSVSVIIPARNESGNIENAIKRTPKMGRHTEIVFVEGGSTDDTWEEIQRVQKKYEGVVDIKIGQQEGKGKGDAMRKGYSIATGDVLMILDADLTVPPEDLPKFYNAIASGKGEYINGTRLVYPMEKEAMRLLNIAGNKFFSIMFSWLLGQRLKDTLCGTKVLSRKNYDLLAANRKYFGDFDPFGDFDLIFGSAKMNLKIVEVPIRYQAREYGDTNISRFRHGWILLKMTAFAMNKIKFI